MTDDAELCPYCCARPSTAPWEPYCGPTCAIDAEEPDLRHGAFFLLRDQLRDVRDELVRREKTQRTCWPKEQHASEGAARAQMRSLLKRGLEKDASLLHPYRCPHCGSWHVGHGQGGV